MKPGYVYSKQESLFGNSEVIGFGTFDFMIEEIPRDLANEIIIKNHYSGKIYNATYIHLGLFSDEHLVGVLQYGYAMNPQSMASVVKDTDEKGYLELNRMWVDDCMPRNSESKAISYSIKYIRNKYPTVAWIQSFADERCGGLGVVYQACSFLYCGEHTAIFWELADCWYHNTSMTVCKNTKRYQNNVGNCKILQENKKDAVKHELRQFRYIKPLKKWARRKLLLPVLPYPKPEVEI